MSEVATEKLVELLQRAGEQAEFGAGELIFEAGDTASSMYVVVSGVVEIARNGKVLEEVAQGGLFGEMALIESLPRSATARARTHCSLASIETRRFWFLVQETPYFAHLVMRVMAQRLRRADTAVVT